jgi:hypothetical protein
MANIPATGLAKQTAFGTPNTTFTPVKFTDIGNTELSINKIENDELFGGLDTFAPENGTREAGVSVSGRAYPGAIGYFLTMIAGAPTTTGSAPNYTHVYKPTDNLPPAYTIGLDEPNGIDAYFTDVRASNLTISQEVGDVATFSLDGIASNRVATAVTVGTSGLETRAFRFSDFTATVNSSAYVNFKSLSLSIENPVSNIFVLDGNSTAVTQEYTGRRSVTFDATLRFENDANSLRAAFEGNTLVTIDFEWEIDANTSLVITVPNARILTHEWTRGFDETTVSITGSAYYDGTLAGSLSFTLKNQVASY